MRQVAIFVVLSLILGGVFFVVSCSKDREGKKVAQEAMGEHGMPADWKFTLPKGDPVEGRKVYVEMQCYKCHEVKGETFPAVAKGEEGIGPELSQMAGMHPVEFFAESVINPDAVIDPGAEVKGYVAQKGESKMPDYNDVMTVKQLADLAAYLASLKGGGHAGH